MKKTVGIGLLVLGSLFFLGRKRPGGAAAVGPSASERESAYGGRAVSRDAFREGLRKVALKDPQIERALAFRDAWTEEGVPFLMQLALIANSIEESGIRLSVRSAVGLRDDEKGGSWTAFQILQPSVRSAARELGLDFSDVVPDSEPTGESLRRFAGNQARVAYFIATNPRYMRLAWDDSDPDMSAFDLFTRWAAGPAWPASRVLSTDTARSILGGRLPSQGTILAAVSALRAAGATIAPGALEKLNHFRVLRDAMRQVGVA